MKRQKKRVGAKIPLNLAALMSFANVTVQMVEVKVKFANLTVTGMLIARGMALNSHGVIAGFTLQLPAQSDVIRILREMLEMSVVL